jgi:hypothetical protein
LVIDSKFVATIQRKYFPHKKQRKAVIPMQGTPCYVKNTRKMPFFENETPPVSCDLGFHDDDQCHRNHHLNMLPLTF